MAASPKHYTATYRDVLNHTFHHKAQINKRILSIVLTSEFLPYYCLIWYLWPFYFTIFWTQRKRNNDTNISR